MKAESHVDVASGASHYRYIGSVGLQDIAANSKNASISQATNISVR
jgi:hypothetical protein